MVRVIPLQGMGREFEPLQLYINYMNIIEKGEVDSISGENPKKDKMVILNNLTREIKDKIIPLVDLEYIPKFSPKAIV